MGDAIDMLRARATSEEITADRAAAHAERPLTVMKCLYAASVLREVAATLETQKQFKAKEPVASMRVDILEQARKLMREYYRAIEDELEYHNCGRVVDLRAIPPHGSLLCGVSLEDRDVDRTLSLICTEADTLETPVMRVVVQRRVP